jgi:hypothetical protein
MTVTDTKTDPSYEAKPHPEKAETFIVVNDDGAVVEEFPPPGGKDDAEDYAQLLNEIAKSEDWSKEDHAS